MSHEVQLRRRETKSHLPAPVVANSKKVLSSVYVGQGPLKGLEGDEEKQWLSKHLGMDPDERDFPRVARDFWANLRVEIPTEGKVLNIAKVEDRPANLYDYIVFKWAKKHPFVADTRDDMLDNSKYQYYVHDPEIATQKENEIVSFKMKSYDKFIRIKDDEQQVNRVIRLLTDSDPESMSLKQKQNLLANEIDSNPKRFFVIATDKHLETKAIISEMISHGIINKIGNQHYFIDEKLGDTTDEAVKYFNDKKNSKTTTLLKAKLQEKQG